MKTSLVPAVDQHLSQTRRNLLASIDVLMGGRAAEEIFLGDKEVTSGCEKDLEKATNIAYNLVMRFGFNEDLSLLSLTEKGRGKGKAKNRGV
jgi:ATP-dependent metalloprotease